VPVCLDLGSRNCVVVSGRKAKTYPSALAVEEYTGRILAFGEEAKELEGRCPPRTSIVHPIARGLVADLEGTRQLVRLILEDAVGWRRYSPGSLRLVTSTGLGRLEKNVLTEAVRGGGGGQPLLRYRALGAAFHQGRDPADPETVAVIDLGAETTEMSIFAGGRLYRCRSLARGGQDLTHAILRGLSEERQIEVGMHTAEHLKRALGSAILDGAPAAGMVEGRGRASGLPETLEVSRSELVRWCQPELDQLESAARQVFGHLDPDVASDLVHHGALLIGGGARLRGIDSFLSSALGLAATVAAEPETCGALGGVTLEIGSPERERVAI
jgi:rod shape-determining protein MreB